MIRTLVDLLTRVHRVETVQYVLTMIDDMLFVRAMQDESPTKVANVQSHRESVQQLWTLCAKQGQTPWQLFLPMLAHEDGYVMNQAAHIIGKLACWSGRDKLMTGVELATFFSFVKERIRAPVREVQDCHAVKWIVVAVEEYLCAGVCSLSADDAAYRLL